MTRIHRPSDGLVAILNDQRDFEILQREGWYRIPVSSAPRRWPPRWLAFYQMAEQLSLLEGGEEYDGDERSEG